MSINLFKVQVMCHFEGVKLHSEQMSRVRDHQAQAFWIEHE